MREEDSIELKPSDGGDEFEYKPNRDSSGQPMPPWKAKLIFWSLIIGGIAVGTIIFLTFLSLFIYFFVPIVVIVGIWALINTFRGR